MTIKTMHRPQSPTQNMHFDLVVIGGGLAGLNALYAATHYLPGDAKVLLIEQRAEVGGMWNSVYDYVRLHQAHRHFTVGNLKWALRKPAGYLPTGDEVLEHLSTTIALIGEKVKLHTRLLHTVTVCEEVPAATGFCARVQFHPNEHPQDVSVVTATRAIYASGHDCRDIVAKEYTSQSVISISPTELSNTLASHRSAPVYVIGGGKTGMDTVTRAVNDHSQRKVTLVNGQGTLFISRDKVQPYGLKRWTTNSSITRLMRDLAFAYDGKSANNVIPLLRKIYSTAPSSDYKNFMYAVQSTEEHSKIEAGLSQTLRSYVEDVVDTSSGVEMRMRDNRRIPVEAGAIFVNCTGTIFRSDAVPSMVKLLSPNDTVLTINLRDGFAILTGVSAFFLTHLLFRNKIRGQGFYSFDHETLFRQNRSAWVGATSAQGYLNQVFTVKTLPLRILDSCSLDLDRWYPPTHRLAKVIKMRAFASREINHCRNVLEKTARNFSIHCQPIE